MKFKIATWNVNSVRARESHLVSFLERHQPDVVCLQEIKCENDLFPLHVVFEHGYQAVIHGQKSYNGVAILSRQPLSEPVSGMDSYYQDSQARVVACTVNGVRIISAYVPNGQEPGSEKYAYKLSWMEGFKTYLKDSLRKHDLLIVGGDFNVAPDDLDVHDPKKWIGKILCTDEERKRFSALLDEGLLDTYRELYPETQIFSWWDYRMGNFQRNAGLRIDFLLSSPELFSVCDECAVSLVERSGEKPSDHAPVIAEFEI